MTELTAERTSSPEAMAELERYRVELTGYCYQVPIQQLRAGVTGRVISPHDAEYDRARTVVGGGIDPRPAAIVMVADADDVATVVMVARESGAELAVRSGGYSGAAHGTVDVGIVKARYDPDKVFHRNQSVAPAAG